MEHLTYGIVGRGRVATHFSRYLQLESLPVRQWHRGMSRAPERVLANVDVVLLAISDDALEPFLAERPELAAKTCVHFSGSRSVRGAQGLHPLMTFGPDPYDLETYRAIPFIFERGGRDFRAVFPALKNLSWALDPPQKALYHAFCVLAGNLPTLLWARAFDAFEQRLGLPRRILAPYLEQALRNTLASGGAALTGPLARGDRDTVARNLEALEGDACAGIYRAFAHAYGLEEA